ncbi:MobC family plasmid mobilization relaxosome protein [Zooshikella sp. RANM57]|uniref:MobC family plasmid mobilization relaxosome protein n=1 Tax=Zooshikella sp. RANM57 TaxID=3425863 RepID=UPI003D6F3BD3
MADKRRNLIKILATDTEYEALKARSTRPQLARWMRETCLEEKTAVKARKRAVDPALLRQLAGLGNNLNQIARKVNASGLDALHSVQLLSELQSISVSLVALQECHSDDR